MARALLLYNPAAHNAPDPSVLRVIARELELGGFSVDQASSRVKGDLARLAAEAARDGIDRVVVCGGDGSVREAAQGLQGTLVPLAVVPLGTVNVLAKEMGLPHRSPVACAVEAARGTAFPVGLGAVGLREVFTFCASCGLDSQAVADVDEAMKDERGAWAYAYSALRSVILAEVPRLTVELDDGRRLQGCQIFAARAKRYGGGSLFLTRKADLKAPHMRVLVVDGPLGPRLPGLLVGLGTTEVESVSGVTAVDSTSFRLESAHPLPVQADGDSVGRTPATITSRGAALTLVFPREAL